MKVKDLCLEAVRTIDEAHRNSGTLPMKNFQYLFEIFASMSNNLKVSEQKRMKYVSQTSGDP